MGGGGWGGRVTPPGLVLWAGNGFSPLYTALCISIKANGTKQNPITGEQTGGLSAARPLYCFNRGANGAFGATGMLSEKHVSPHLSIKTLSDEDTKSPRTLNAASTLAMSMLATATLAKGVVHPAVQFHTSRFTHNQYTNSIIHNYWWLNLSPSPDVNPNLLISNVHDSYSHSGSSLKNNWPRL